MGKCSHTMKKLVHTYTLTHTSGSEGVFQVTDNDRRGHVPHRMHKHHHHRQAERLVLCKKQNQLVIV